ncbi:MFS transporter [Tomitella biformata]|uniref:MFS transporter n=1 Tax=Tomitella biformata TaxID=630403 RepID=UPI0004635309|nr:MFS transporter [Tomitella biformata]
MAERSTSYRLTRRQQLGYGLGSFGTGGFGVVPGLLLAFYLTDSLGVAAGLAGFVVFAPKVWDVVISPIVGRLTDRTLATRGDRRPWLLAGALVLPLFFALTFLVPPGLTGAPAALWVAVFFLLAASGYVLFQVPYVTMPTELTDNPAERTTITAWRIAFLTVAILLFGVTAPMLVQAGGGNRGGYALMGIVLGVGIALGMFGAWRGTRGITMVQLGEVSGTVRQQLRAAAGNRPFIMLLAAFILQAVATGAMLAGAPYLARYILGSEGLTAVLFGCLVGPALLVMPIWHKIAGVIGKRNGFVAATVVFAAGSTGLLAARSLPPVGVYLLVGVVGIGYAGLQLFPLAMLPDTLAEDSRVTGSSRAGIFTGVWTAGETTGLALGPFLVVSFVLGLSGYVASTGDQTVIQPDSAMRAIVWSTSLVPALFALLSIPFVLAHRTPAVLEESEVSA